MDLQKKTLYILLEIQSRELDSQLLLTTYFISKGYRVYIGDSKSIFKLLKKKKDKGGIFLNKGSSPYTDTKLIKKKCDQYAILDQELTPGFYNKILDYIFVARFFAKTDKLIDRYYVINKIIAFRAKKFFKKTNSNVVVMPVGWPRFDLLKKEFHKIYEKDIQKYNKKYKKHILFNSDFGHLSDEEILNAENNLLTRFDEKKSLEHQKKRAYFFKDELKHLKENLKNTKLFLEKLSKDYPQINFVIRSHPGEYISEWIKFCKKLKNFKVQSSKNSIISAILSSEGILHRGCTSGYESILLNKKSGYIDVTKNEKERLAFRKPLYLNSFKIKDKQSFEFYLGQKFPNYLHKKRIEYLLNSKKNEYAFEKIFNDIDSLKVNKEISYDYLELNFNNQLNSGLLFKLKEILYDILIILKIKPERNHRYGKIEPKTDKKFKLKKIKQIISQILNTKKFKNLKLNFTVKNLSDKLIEIDSK